jgi:predicted O-methyltransferase YrrM
LRPKVVIETGVASGLSTAYLLQAIADNEEGHLWSIDLPNVDSLEGSPRKYIPDQAVPGWLVPEGLKRNWTLVLGDARAQLPAVLSETGRVDVFIHDSMHTYEHMSWEYNEVWKRLSAGGCLFSHDVHVNSAFADFCLEKGRPPGRFRNLGIVRK